MGLFRKKPPKPPPPPPKTLSELVGDHKWKEAYELTKELATNRFERTTQTEKLFGTMALVVFVIGFFVSKKMWKKNKPEQKKVEEAVAAAVGAAPASLVPPAAEEKVEEEVEVEIRDEALAAAAAAAVTELPAGEKDVVPAVAAAEQEPEDEEEEAPLAKEGEVSSWAAASSSDVQQQQKEEEEVVSVSSRKAMAREDTILDLGLLPSMDEKEEVGSSKSAVLDPVLEEEEQSAAKKSATAFGAGHVGQRKKMEDVWCEFSCGGAIFDGAGGARAARICSETISESYSSSSGKIEVSELLSEEFMKKALDKAERATLESAEKARPKWPDATTAVVGVHDERFVRVGWVGDSVAILIAKDGEEVLTQSHAASNPAEAKRVKAAGGRVGKSEADSKKKFIKSKSNNPLRIYPGGITLTRALGGLPLKFSRPKLLIEEPEFVARLRKKSDFCLLLASDGLLEKLDLPTISNIVRKHHQSGKLEQCADALVRAAVKASTNDNVSVLCLFL